MSGVLLGSIFAAKGARANYEATTAPGVTNDVDEGYSVGSHWYDTTADKAYVCLDASDGAAVWLEYGQAHLLNKLDGTVAPGVGDDSDDGYAEGSFWIDQVADEAYRCVDASVGAAVWINTTLETSELAVLAVSGEGTDVLSTGEAGGNKFLGEDGDGSSSWKIIEGAVIGSLGEAAGTVLTADGADGASWGAAPGWDVDDDIGFNYGHGGTALDSLTTGTDNIGLGQNALTAVATGTYNIGIGTDALGDASFDSHYCIGIGPRAALNVTSGLRNIALGYAAGSTIATGADNVCLGYLSDTGAASTAEGTAVGNRAQTGSAGVAVGFRAGQIMTGADNTVVGAYAGDAITTGERNTALGKNALGANVGGTDNVAIGYDAGLGITGYYNVAIGVGTLDSLNHVGAMDNVAIGYWAAQDLTGIGADNNTAVGRSALQKNTGGSDNTAIGEYAAAWGVASFSSVTALGKSAGYYNTGNVNIFLGANAAVAHTSGDYCIFIGTLDPLAPTDDDQLVVGNNTVNPISGYMGARSDVDYSGKDLTLTGPSAWASAAANQNGGDLILRGGQKASGGGTSGDTQVEAPIFRDKSDVTKKVAWDLTAITTANTRTITMPDADVDLGTVGQWNVEDTTNHTYGHGTGAVDSVTVGSGLRNIGIGTDAGTAITTGDDNLAVGNYALQSVTTTQANHAFGYEAGRDCTGIGNTFLGYRAGKLTANSNGAVCVGYLAGEVAANNEYNTVVGGNAFAVTGSKAGRTVTLSTIVGGAAGDHFGASPVTTDDADECVAIGYASLKWGGIESIAIGNYTLGYNAAVLDQPGIGNVAIGHSAMDKIQAGGTYNIAIGHSSGSALTVGDNNTFVGTSAGAASTDTLQSVAVGASALSNADAGDNCVAIGYQALYNATGADNVVIGAYAGDAITTGARNTLVGRDAGTGFSTGNDNVLIGYQAGDSLALTDSSAVIIGSGADSTHGSTVVIGYNTTGGQDCVAIGASILGTVSGVAIGKAVKSYGSENVIIGEDAASNLDVANGGQLVLLGQHAGDGLTTGNTAIMIGHRIDAPSATDNYQIAIGTQNAVYPISGYMGADADVDMSGKNLTIRGSSAYSAATVNQSGGALNLYGGAKASGGGNIGPVNIAESAGYLGFFGATAVVQPSGTGETTGFTAGAGTGVNDDSTFTGNVGATAYRISDIVKALKNLGLLAQ